MKIALIAPSEIPARRANTIQVMKMAQAFTRLSSEVLLVIPDSQGSYTKKPGNIPSWEQLARHYGLTNKFKMHWLPAWPQMRRYDFSLRAVRWARKWNADLCYTRLPQAAALSSLSGLPTVLEIHDLPQGKLGPWMLHLFLKGKGAVRLVAITHILAGDLAQRLNVPSNPPFTIIAPDGVDLERFANLPAPQQARRQVGVKLPNLPAEKFTVGYTGHLYPGRGVDLLLRLAALLPEISFLIVGGEARDISRVQNQVQQSQIKNLVLAGFVPNAELPLYQAACDILLLPYQAHVAASSGGDIARYLSPMKLFEYLACGRAILSSDLPVLQEILNAQNAILLPATDLTAWAEAIKRVESDPAIRERLAAQAQQDAAMYTWEQRAGRILEGL